jgi:hypothetical protein
MPEPVLEEPKDTIVRARFDRLYEQRAELSIRRGAGRCLVREQER